MKTCDLHCHSNFSDGSNTPEEVIDLACSAGLSAVALTDHNTVGGIERAVKAADGRIELCCGCEFTTEVSGQELHLLGLFLKPDRINVIQGVLSAQLARKEESNRVTIERLKEAGYPVSFDEFIKLYGTGVKNRVHIARYLISKGIVSDVNEAYLGILSSKGEFYQKTERQDFFEMIPLIREAGGVAVWAHPLFHVNKCECEKILAKSKEYGLDGVEVYYSTYTSEETSFMKELCHRYNVLESGGSDFHGENKPEINIGNGYGNLEIPYSCYENLKALAELR